MLHIILLPLLALLGGVGGFFLRRWELATAFEPSGLARPWSAATLALIGLSVVLALLILVLSGRAKRRPNTYASAFSADGNWGYLVLMALSCAHLLIAGLAGMWSELHSTIHPLRLLLWGMCILSFFCVLYTALSNFRGTLRQRSLALLVPGYTCCLWLASAYHQQATDPVVLGYVYELLAILCTLLALYFAAGFSFTRGRVRLCAAVSLLSIYFSMVTLADGHALPYTLLFLSSAFYQLATVLVLLRCTFTPHNTPSQDLNHTQEVTPDE